MSGKHRIIVAGAGASGMVAAIEAAKRGMDVTILEANDRAGKKIYATGNGRCNLTNRRMKISCYNGTDKAFIKSVLDRFGYAETIEYFSELGLMFKDRDGYIYPMSGQAASVAEALLSECKRLDIKILCNVTARDITVNKNRSDGYIVSCITGDGKKMTFTAEGVILSCGSIAGISPKKYPAGSGYDLAKRAGHSIAPLVSSLTGIRCKNESFYRTASGVRCDAVIVIYEKASDGTERMLASDKGELQLTDYGVSGIPAFQVSRHAAYSIRDRSVTDTYCIIDFLPDVSEQELRAAMRRRIERNGENTVLQYFNGILNDKLARALLQASGISVKKRGKELKQSDIDRIAGIIKHFRDSAAAVNDFQNAQVLAGGVRLTELTDSMESVYAKNLYITGELLDADGICGGYNLQWAWATGYIAGNAVLSTDM